MFLRVFSILAVFLTVANCQYFRLPLNLVPYHYDLEILAWLEPEFEFLFGGNVGINFTCVDDTDLIVLHNYELTVDEANVVLTVSFEFYQFEIRPKIYFSYYFKDSRDDELSINRHEYDLGSDTDFQNIYLDERLTAGESYRLVIPYVGFMREQYFGLFYGSYDNPETESDE
jgi:hypothetical protein